MKKLIYGLIAVSLIMIPLSTFAITPTQLEQAEDTLRQMDSKISVLRGYVQIAYRGTSEDITLTSTQIQDLKDKYLLEKAELVTLYNQLP